MKCVRIFSSSNVGLRQWELSAEREVDKSRTGIISPPSCEHEFDSESESAFTETSGWHGNGILSHMGTHNFGKYVLMGLRPRPHTVCVTNAQLHRALTLSY